MQRKTKASIWRKKRHEHWRRNEA